MAFSFHNVNCPYEGFFFFKEWTGLNANTVTRPHTYACTHTHTNTNANTSTHTHSIKICRHGYEKPRYRLINRQPRFQSSSFAAEQGIAATHQCLSVNAFSFFFFFRSIAVCIKIEIDLTHNKSISHLKVFSRQHSFYVVWVSCMYYTYWLRGEAQHNVLA